MLRIFLGIIAILAVAGAPAARAAPCVDVALVLAVDGSGSITDEEFAFQKDGIAAALRTDEVTRALAAAGTVALSAVFWGDGEFAVQKLGWHIVRGRFGLEDFARAIQETPRKVFGNTDIGSGLWGALDMLADPAICAPRMLVNLSGDGRETIAPKRRQVASLAAARRRAAEMGVTVNALTVSEEVPDLAEYYAKSVIVGTGSFVMEVRRGSDFAAAFRKKLVRELTPQTVAALRAASDSAGRVHRPALRQVQK